MLHKADTSLNRSEFNIPDIFAGYNLAASDRLLCTVLPLETADGAVQDELQLLGAQCGSREVLALGQQANRHLPELKAIDAYGRRADLVEYHPAYHTLMRRSFKVGLHCSSLDGGANPFANLQRARKIMVMGQVEAGQLCPLTMTNAAGAVLGQQGSQFLPWLQKISSRTYDQRHLPMSAKEGVTLGMGLTEKQGGTDLRQISTTASFLSGERYQLNGHKWFFSAPMSDGFLILAKTTKGISCFLVPRLNEEGGSNGLNLVRLKEKLGNQANASSEVEIHNSHGYLVGEEGQGIKTIMGMVMPTRLDCCLGSAAVMRIAILRALHHASCRRVFQKKLIDQPVMTSVLADMALDCAAATSLGLQLALHMDLRGRRYSGQELSEAYLRVIIPAAKYWICKVAPTLVCEAMECLGGNGYVEDHGMARLYREAPVNGIWEGSGSVMALDLLRVLEKQPEMFELVLEHLQQTLGAAGEAACDVLSAARHEAIYDASKARFLCEQLAMTAAAAVLRQICPESIADAFMESRLAGGWRSSYGMLPARFEARQLLDWLYSLENGRSHD
ncbi:acyl-CoA dehydrogenase family protein [Polycladidibacter stylochi]|uniref:acyl-CoA dehydrogenase family protein n=1 Tax=Polycladidibacter stylochi TaxID=1807766 RepID=UPI0008365216|nr:acyl-CoA dehydrogenase family protein [Pseudovibrio stylochi]